MSRSAAPLRCLPALLVLLAAGATGGPSARAGSHGSPGTPSDEPPKSPATAAATIDARALAHDPRLRLPAGVALRFDFTEERVRDDGSGSVRTGTATVSGDEFVVDAVTRRIERSESSAEDATATNADAPAGGGQRHVVYCGRDRAGAWVLESANASEVFAPADAGVPDGNVVRSHADRQAPPNPFLAARGNGDRTIGEMVESYAKLPIEAEAKGDDLELRLYHFARDERPFPFSTFTLDRDRMAVERVESRWDGGELDSTLVVDGYAEADGPDGPVTYATGWTEMRFAAPAGINAAPPLTRTVRLTNVAQLAGPWSAADVDLFDAPGGGVPAGVLVTRTDADGSESLVTRGADGRPARTTLDEFFNPNVAAPAPAMPDTPTAAPTAASASPPPSGVRATPVAAVAVGIVVAVLIAAVVGAYAVTRRG